MDGEGGLGTSPAPRSCIAAFCFSFSSPCGSRLARSPLLHALLLFSFHPHDFPVFHGAPIITSFRPRLRRFFSRGKEEEERRRGDESRNFISYFTPVFSRSGEGSVEGTSRCVGGREGRWKRKVEEIEKARERMRRRVDLQGGSKAAGFSRFTTPLFINSLVYLVYYAVNPFLARLQDRPLHVPV